MEVLGRVHGPALYVFLIGATAGDRHAAEDLVRETFRRSWQTLEPLGPDVDNVGPWLHTIARRVAVDYARARRTHPGGPGVESTTDGAIAGAATDIHAGSEGLTTALAQVVPEQRRVVVELYIHGRSVAETAGLLGIPAGTVTGHAYDGLRALRTTIDRAAAGPAGSA